MSRVVALLLAVLLPLQFAWAAAAGYCGHEAEATAQPPAAAVSASAHFGHHEHVHLSADGTPAAAKLAVDNDCSACHAALPAITGRAVATVGLPLTGRRVHLPPLAAPGSAPSAVPDRPQWIRLA